MKKNFWPIYVIVAALGAAAIWTQTPRYYAALPEGLRFWCRDVVAKATGRAVPSAETTAPAPAAAPVDEVKPLASAEPAKNAATAVVAQVEAPKPAAVPQPAAPQAEETKPEEAKTDVAAAEPKKDEAPATETAEKPVAEKADQPAAEPAAEAAAEKPVVAAAGADVKASDLPSMRGVQPADPKTATWGVVNRTTELVGLDGDYLGQVAGGRFFEIERRFRSEEGLMLVGNFWPKKLEAPVQAPAENFTCFSGAPKLLSKKQLRALRKYYESRAEANDLRQELLKPKYDERTGREIKGPRVDPRKDPRYQELMEAMQEAAADIVGLAF